MHSSSSSSSSRRERESTLPELRIQTSPTHGIREGNPGDVLTGYVEVNRTLLTTPGFVSIIIITERCRLAKFQSYRGSETEALSMARCAKVRGLKVPAGYNAFLVSIHYYWVC